MKRIILPLMLLSLSLNAQTSSTCRSTLAADAEQVAAQLSAIAAQANAQGFNAAVQDLARQLQTLAPTLSRPDQALIDTFIADLKAATDAAGPGGTNITNSEKLRLSTGLTNILLSTGMTLSDINTLLANTQAVFASLEGINPAALRAAIEKTISDAKACRPR